jgi:hypothetical protein
MTKYRFNLTLYRNIDESLIEYLLRFIINIGYQINNLWRSLK